MKPRLPTVAWQMGLPAAPLAVGALGLILFSAAPTPGALLGVVLVLATVAMRPWITIPLIVLTLPFYLHPRAFLGLECSATEATIIAAVVGVVGHRAWCAWARRRPATLAIRPHPLDGAVGLMLLAGLLSLLVTEYPRQSLRELRWLLVEPILVLYLARATVAPAHRVRALWSLVAAGTLAAGIGLGALTVSGLLADPSVRALHPYLSANHLGLFLGRAIAVALALVAFTGAWGGRATPPPVGVASLVVMGLALLRTLSLGAWTGAAAAAVVITAPYHRRWLVVVTTLAVLVTLVAILVLPPERTFERFAPETGTGRFRVQIWVASLHMIADHPVLGIGLDNFLYAYRNEYMLPDAWQEPNISHPHNLVLHFWLQLGLLGLAAAGWLVYGVARASVRMLRDPTAPDDRVVAAAALGTLAGFVVHGSFDNSYFLVDAAVVWWIMVALVQQTEPSRRAAQRGAIR